MPSLKRIALGSALGLATLALLLAGTLWLTQERLIYPAPHYAPRQLAQLPVGLTALRDASNPASVLGFYRGPEDGAALRRLWLVFGGNGELALQWDAVLAGHATHDMGFLMVEYPGYGAHVGVPSPETLLRGTEATLAILSQHLAQPLALLRARVSVLGYSLGSAAALQYAASQPVERIVLLAPFTSMLDMACRSVGAPLCYLLTHRYDNRASLRAVVRRGACPLFILHGERDTLIPPDMGQSLAAGVPGGHFELVAGANHLDLVSRAELRLKELLTQP
jgi:pimeloyl-ACP methyl ester carboxylesterase